MPKAPASGPSSSTTEMASWPIIWGRVLKSVRPEVMLTSEWQREAAWTRTRRERPVGVGIGTWSIDRGLLGLVY